MKMVRVHVGLWLVLLIGGFLLGFVPEYQKNRELEAQLAGPEKTIDALRLQIGLGELRDAASLMFMEVSRQNYGLARDHANEFHTKASELINGTADETLKKNLTDLSTEQDSLAAGLIAPTPATVTAAQALMLKTIEVTKNAVPK